jgi:hypothetical protein
MKPWKVKKGGGLAPQNYTYIEYCAREKLWLESLIYDMKWGAHTLVTFFPK